MSDKNIVLIAKKWIGVPFLNGGTTIYGCDCIGLIIGILKEYNINIKDNEYFELGFYDHLNLDNIYLVLAKYCEKIDVIDVKIGDLIMFSSYKNTAHFAIITNLQPLSIVHANQSAGKVVETISDKLWNTQILSYWRVKNI